MGIQLNWDIEAEKAKSKRVEEDPKQRKNRQRGCVRALLFVLIIGGIVGGVGYGIFWRYNDVTDRLESSLRNTVQTEAAALRIGDINSFSNIQRSATDTWIIAQQQTFQMYQTLKQTTDINLTGNVVNLEISGQRGRVQVEEIRDGVSYVQTWFYWNYNTDTDADDDTDPDGWRHVPPDFTFWGEAATLQNERFEIRYQALDQPVAEAIEAQLSSWLEVACSLFDCSDLPPITMDIVSEAFPRIEWATNEAANTWQMVVPSPYVELARLDQPFDIQRQLQAAILLADRFVDEEVANDLGQYTDAVYVRDAISNWLVGRFVQRDTGAYLINSLVQNSGEAAINQVLAQLQPLTTIDILASATGNNSVAEMSLDWRDHVVWRLATEDAVIQARDEVTLRQLYDPRDPNILNTALARYDVAVIPEERIIVNVTQGVAADGLPQLQAQVQITRNAQVTVETILFNLVDGRWLRAN